METMKGNEMKTEVIQVGTSEYRVAINGMVRCYVTGTRGQAEAEAARIVKGIEADARWMKR